MTGLDDVVINFWKQDPMPEQVSYSTFFMQPSSHVAMSSIASLFCMMCSTRIDSPSSAFTINR